MSAEISIESQQYGASKYWIDKTVFRLGGTTECEVHLPGLDENSVTVQFRDNEYLVWNRLPTPLKLGRRIIATNAVGKWKARNALHIGPYQLTLLIKGHPQPVPQSRTSRNATATDGIKEAPGTKSANANFVNIAALIAIAGILMFLLNNKGNAGPAQLEPIVQELMVGSNGEDAFAGKIRNSLQQGRDAETRNNTQTAIEHYLTARDQILQSQLDKETKLRLLNYLNQRLQRLNW